MARSTSVVLYLGALSFETHSNATSLSYALDPYGAQGAQVR